MPASNPFRIPALVLAALAAAGALLLALFDASTALILLAALALGWALRVGLSVGRAAYQRQRAWLVGGGALVVLVLLVLFRPDGAPRSTGAGPMPVSGYGAELWPNRLTGGGSFILRERADLGRRPGEDAVEGRATLEPVSTGPLMREIRFVPGAAGGIGPLRLIERAEAVIVVNPIDGGEFAQVRGGDASRVELPIGEIVRVRLGRLPGEARVAYFVGAGRALSGLGSLVLPLRALPLALSALLFALLGGLAAHAWSDRLVAPVRKRLMDRPPPPASGAPGPPGSPIERAPLVPRRK